MDKEAHQVLYLVNYQWFKKLIKHILHSDPHPGPIENESIYNLYQQNFSIVLGKNVILVTLDMWNYLI